MRVAGRGKSLEIICTKARDSELFAPVPFRLQKHGDSLVVVTRKGNTEPRGTGLSVAALSALRTLSMSPGGQASSGEWKARWMAETGKSHGTFATALAQLFTAGLVVKAEGKRGSYALTEGGEYVIRPTSNNYPSRSKSEDDQPSKSPPPPRGVGLDDDTIDGTRAVGDP
jgi:hypothetical protein